jgi:hypothetical protein
VALQGAYIDDQLQMNDSIFENKVTMSAVRIGNSVMMRSAQFKGDVDLHASYIGKNLSMSNSSFLGTLTLNGAQVAGSVILDNIDPDRPDRNAIPEVRKLDFTGARIANIPKIFYRLRLPIYFLPNDLGFWFCGSWLSITLHFSESF